VTRSAGRWRQVTVFVGELNWF